MMAVGWGRSLVRLVWVVEVGVGGGRRLGLGLGSILLGEGGDLHKHYVLQLACEDYGWLY